MITVIKNIYLYRELIQALAVKNIIVRYKQSYLGISWAVFRPLMLMLIFTLVRSFVGIDTGGIPYPVLTYAALLPWLFFQDSTTEGVTSVTANANLIRKIYFPREVFPLTAMFTKVFELCISFFILGGLMIYYQIIPTMHALWVPLFIAYIVLVSLMLSFFGAAMNVYFRDISQALPIAFSILMYASPVIYPLTLVHKKLIVEQAAGAWSEKLYYLYMLNPMAGIIDNFQLVLIKGQAPDFQVIYPGLLCTAVLLPIGYLYFKKSENWFADVI